MIAFRRLAPPFARFFVLMVILSKSMAVAHGQLPYKAPKEMLQAVLFTPDGKTLMSGGLRLPPKGPDRAFVKQQDLASGKERELLKDSLPHVTAMAFAPDGRTLATATLDKTVVHWELATGKQLVVLRGLTGNINKLTFSADGKSLVSVGAEILENDQQENQVLLWDLVKGQQRGQLKGLAAWQGHTAEVHAVAFSPDGKFVVSGSRDRTVRIWDSSTGEAKFTVSGFTSIGGKLAFAPDSKRLLTGGVDRELHLFEVETGKALGTWKQIEVVDSLAIAPDGNTVAVGTRLRLPVIGGGMVILWDLNKAKERIRWQVHPDHVVLTSAFSPDGRWVVTGDSGNGIQVWEVATGKRKAKLLAHREMVWSVAWNRDGKTLVSGSFDGTVKLWDWTAILTPSISAPMP